MAVFVNRDFHFGNPRGQHYTSNHLTFRSVFIFSSCAPQCCPHSLPGVSRILLLGVWRARPDGTFTAFDAPRAGTGFRQGRNISTGFGLNPGEMVTGWVIDASSVNHGYVRAPDGTFTTFDAPSAGTSAGQGTVAFGINPAGGMGYYVDGSYVTHGFLRK